MGDILVTPARCSEKYVTYTRSLAVYAIGRYATPGVSRLRGGLQRRKFADGHT